MGECSVQYSLREEKKCDMIYLRDSAFFFQEQISYRMPPTRRGATRRKNAGFNFNAYYQNLPSTSGSSSLATKPQHVTNGAANDNDDFQFVSLQRRPVPPLTAAHRPRAEPPSLIPIPQAFQSSLMQNGHSSSDLSTSHPVTVQPVRGRRSILNFSKNNRVSY
jgi:hypothetical protein